MENLQALSLGEFMFLGCLSYGIFLLCDFLASVTIKFINKIKDKKGRENNEEK